MGSNETPLSHKTTPHLEQVIRGLELVINDETLNVHHKKFLIYLKNMLRMGDE